MPGIDEYHEDAADRLEGERHAGVVIRDSHILMINRHRHGLDFWVLPGGHRRVDEPGPDCVMREVFEETGIRVGSPELVNTLEYDIEGRGHVKEFYYACQWESGQEPSLSGEEARRNTVDNTYTPAWVGLDRLPDLNILPPQIKLWLCQNYSPVA